MLPDLGPLACRSAIKTRSLSGSVAPGGRINVRVIVSAEPLYDSFDRGYDALRLRSRGCRLAYQLPPRPALPPSSARSQLHCHWPRPVTPWARQPHV